MQRFRVECNFGCRYFKDIDKARKYYNKCQQKHLDVELWVITYLYSPVYNKYAAFQELMAYTATNLPKC